MRRSATPVHLAVSLGILLITAQVTDAITPVPATFNNYEVAGNPFVTGFSVGTTCPNSQGTCVNTQGEPSIRADRAAVFLADVVISPILFLGAALLYVDQAARSKVPA